MGYIKAGSRPSLISGCISGVALAIAAYISLQNPAAGFALATFLALALLIVFALRFRRTRKLMPAGWMAILSLVAAVGFASLWQSSSNFR
jgi:uncharacterized membrane protein (UPF0136 family)